MSILPGSPNVIPTSTVIAPREVGPSSSTPSSSTVATVSIELTAHHLAATSQPRESAHKLKYEEVHEINNKLKEINKKTGGWFKFGLDLLKFVYVVTVVPCVIGSFFDGWGHLSNWQQDVITKRIETAKDAYLNEKTTQLQSQELQELDVDTLKAEVTDYEKIISQTSQVVKGVNCFYKCLNAFSKMINWACKLKENSEGYSDLADDRIIKEWLDFQGNYKVIQKMGKFLPNELQIKERNLLNDAAFIKNLPEIQKQLRIVIRDQAQFQESIYKKSWKKGEVSDKEQVKIKEKFTNDLETMGIKIEELDVMMKSLDSAIGEIGIRNDPVVNDPAASEGLGDLVLLVLGGIGRMFFG